MKIFKPEAEKFSSKRQKIKNPKIQDIRGDYGSNQQNKNQTQPKDRDKSRS